MNNYFKYGVKKTVNVNKIVTVHYFELTKDFEYPPESHNFWELHYLDKGHLFCYADNKKNELFQGDLILYKPMVEHCLSTDKNTSSNLFVISFDCTIDKSKNFSNSKYKLTYYEKSLISKIFEEANKTFILEKLEPSLTKMKLNPCPPIGSMQVISNTLEELLIRLMRRQFDTNTSTNKLNITYDDKIVNDLIKFLNENLTKKISLLDISNKMGYGKTFLCTRFKKTVGKTIFRYLNELLIEEAKKLIREDKENTLSYISDLLNFNDPAYFSSVFKKITGMSPKEYSKTIHAFDKD